MGPRRRGVIEVEGVWVIEGGREAELERLVVGREYERDMMLGFYEVRL